MQRIEITLRRVSGLFSAAGCLVMLAMFVLVSANIIGRPFGASIRGTVEMSGFLCALAVGLCLPGAQFAGSHISAGLCSGRLPRPVRGLDRALVSLVCLFLLGLAAYELKGLADYAREMDEYIDGFDISYYGMVLGLAAGLTLHAAVFGLELLKLCDRAAREVSGGLRRVKNPGLIGSVIEVPGDRITADRSSSGAEAA